MPYKTDFLFVLQVFETVSMPFQLTSTEEISVNVSSVDIFCAAIIWLRAKETNCAQSPYSVHCIFG